SRSGPSIALYSPALARLIDALRDVPGQAPSEEELAATGSLLQSALAIYEGEEQRQRRIFRHLQDLLRLNVQVKPQELEESQVMGDGAVITSLETGEKAVFCYIKVKNELGDAGLQAALTYRRHIAQSSYERVRNVSPCPCIIVAIAGPYICFQGAVFAPVPVVEHLTDYIYLGGQTLKRARIDRLARIFRAVSEAMHGLRREYNSLKGNDELELSCLFPRPLFLQSLDPTESELVNSLKYVDRLNYLGIQKDGYRKVLFRARTGDKDVVVKFCEVYHARAHGLLADQGLAPRLHLCAKVVGGLHMVVMDLIPNGNAYHRFLKPHPSKIDEDVEKAVKTLHAHNIVFGDLRQPNILIVNREGDEEGGMLIDFDWAAEEVQGRYPPVINDSGEIKWAPGVTAAGIMRKEHDLFMLEHL
ncbi:hypothetical protein BC834DRAFT_820680, partial [Gloeopeniophorella convolvens]